MSSQMRHCVDTRSRFYRIPDARLRLVEHGCVHGFLAPLSSISKALDRQPIQRRIVGDEADHTLARMGLDCVCDCCATGQALWDRWYEEAIEAINEAKIRHAMKQHAGLE